ncbi:MAG: ParB/RepB/Spo0J family partition protein [Gemmataceae bacterium]
MARPKSRTKRINRDTRKPTRPRPPVTGVIGQLHDGNGKPLGITMCDLHRSPGQNGNGNGHHNGHHKQPPAMKSKEDPVIIRLSPAAIAPPACNVRKHFDAVKMEELIASVKAQGVLQNLIVRKHPKPKGKVTHELVVGERRLRAAIEAGLRTVPVMVQECNDVEVLETQLIENDGRDDFTDMERAAGYQKLLDAGRTVDELAKRVHRSTSVVRNTLLLVRCPEALAKALEAKKVSRSVAELVCRMPNQLLRDRAARCVLTATENPGQLSYFARADVAAAEPLNYPQTRKLIAEHFMRELKGSPFDVNDDTLDKAAGSCKDCPKRTGKSKSYPDSREDVCTDPGCFAGKCAAQRVRTEADARRQSLRVLTPAQCDIVFSHRISESTEWVDLDEPCKAVTKNNGGATLTWEEALSSNKDVAQNKVLAFDGRNYPHWLYDREAAIASLQRSGKFLPTPKAINEAAAASAGRTIAKAMTDVSTVLEGINSKSSSGKKAREALEALAVSMVSMADEFTPTNAIAVDPFTRLCNGRVQFGKNGSRDDPAAKLASFRNWVGSASPAELLGIMAEAAALVYMRRGKPEDKEAIAGEAFDRLVNLADLDMEEIRADVSKGWRSTKR